MTPLYESRQVGWFAFVMIAIMLIMFTVVGATTDGEPVPWWVYVMVVVLTAPMSVMTVRVTRQHVRVQFLFPLFRKTIKMSEIRSCEPYRAEGLGRLQCQVKPLQGRFQLTGSGGVVITCDRGLPIHISDPEPEKLARAVQRARERSRKE